MTIEMILPMELARKFARAYLSSIEGRLDPEDHATQHFAAAMAAARHEGEAKGEYLAQRWKEVADRRYTIDDLVRHRDEGREEGRREGAEQRALDEAVIEAAREMVEAHDAIRTDTAS